MRRPFALLGFSVFAALTLAAWAGPTAAQAGGWCCGALALCAVLGLCAALSPKKNAVSADAAGPRSFFSRQKLRRGLAALGAGLTAAAGAFFLYRAAWQLRAAPYLDLEGQKARVQGTVLDYPQEMYQRTYLLLQVDRVAPAEEGAALPELPGPFTLRVSSALPLLCEPGQVVECTVTFTEFSQTGLYSSQARRLAQGISAGAYLSDFEELSSTRKEEPSSQIRQRVNAARAVQQQRYAGTGIGSNARIPAGKLRTYCPLSGEAQGLLRAAFERLGLSARGYDRVLKVARTIADLDGGGDILPAHVAEAVQYRSLDRKYWENR